MRKWRGLIIFLFCITAQIQAAPYPPEMRDARTEVYKTLGDTKLNLYIFNPPAGGPTAKRAAIVFFFGGGFRGGNPSQFENQCRHLASLGMVAITADYRVSSRNHSTVIESMRDGKSAIRYIRASADRLGIDPQRIAAGGGSAGGSVAAAAAVIVGMEEPASDTRISSRPNALVLFNPAVILAPTDRDEQVGMVAVAKERDEQPEFKGIDTVSISPWHHVAKNLPPTIIFHGKADTTVPYSTVESFTKKMQAAGNRCELVGFDGEKHGFFNYRASGNKAYDESLLKMDRFLASLGYISATQQ